MRVLLFAALLLSPLIAQAGDYSEFDGQLNSASLAKQCGKTIGVAIDWASFEPAFNDNQSPKHAVAYCNGAANGLYWTCDDEPGKAAVGAIQGMDCVYDATATKESLKRKGPRIDVVEGRVRVGFHWDTTDIEDTTKEQVARSIKAPGGAHSLFDQRAIAKSEAYYFGASSMKQRATDRCGKDIEAAIDWSSFLPQLGGNANHDRIVSWSNPVYEGIWNHCDTEPGKAFVAGAITKVVFVWDATATKESLGRKGPRLSLADGVLTAGWNWDTTDGGDTTNAWLGGQH
jgi:hypothetical protein